MSFAKNARVQVFKKGAWHKGNVIGTTKGRNQINVLMKDGQVMKVNSKVIWRHKSPPRYKRACRDVVPLKKGMRVSAPYRRTITIEPVIFSRPCQYGDYHWMIRQPELRKRGIFLFNDNEGQFLTQSNINGSGNDNAVALASFREPSFWHQGQQGQKA